MRDDARPRAAPSETAAADAQGSPLVPPDPVYYGARDLDVLPMPMMPLRFGSPEQGANAPIAGRVLLSVKIDAAGTVDQVAVLAAEPPGQFEAHALKTLAGARFSPGRRAGEAVKSQVTVGVEYDPGTGAGGAR
jgi:protein TonB